jgi:hypothetical protein
MHARPEARPTTTPHARSLTSEDLDHDVQCTCRMFASLSRRGPSCGRCGFVEELEPLGTIVIFIVGSVQVLRPCRWRPMHAGWRS